MSARILLVAAANSTTGGGERHVADLLSGLVERGFDVAVVAPAGGDLGALQEELGVSAYDAPIAGGLSLHKLSAVREAVVGFAPDIVHAHGGRAAAFARVADPLAKQRVVYTVHGIHMDSGTGSFARLGLVTTERVLRSRTARFVTVARSDERKGAALGILDADKTTTVYNGIRLPVAKGSSGAFRQELGLGSDAELAVCIGRFHKQKDHATLLDSFARVTAQRPKAHLALVGSGQLESVLRERSVALGLTGRVHFVQPRGRIADVYCDSDVIVLSSRWEGLPYVIIEAMAYGKPVVATRVDGVPEAVEHGVTGLLVEPGAPDALGDALARLLADAELSRTMGIAGRDAVTRRFGLSRMLDELVTVYEDVIRMQESQA